MDFQAIRKEYEDRGLESDDLDPNPLQQLKVWLQQAIEMSPGPWFEANTMALATADANLQVGVRYVLLKGVVDSGIQFFTNYDSRKGKHLEDNPCCSAAFHWPFLSRQVRIVGHAEKTVDSVSDEYFHSRPRGAQLGAAISNQSAVVESRQDLEKRMSKLEQQLGDEPVPRPAHWGGYLIKPIEFEFWQGRSNRLHDRLIYRWDSESKQWVQDRLAP